MIDWFVVCDAAIECTIWEVWDCMFSVHPEDLEWRLRNREHLVPYFKTSLTDFLNYYVSGWWWKSSQMKIQTIILQMWAESCFVRCMQFVRCKKKLFDMYCCICDRTNWSSSLIDVAFNMVKAVDAWNWESDGDNNFKFKEHDEEYDEWNKESTLKMKEGVVSVRE